MSKGGRWGTTEVVRETGVSVRQLHYWEYQGYITPSLQRGRTSGVPHQWSDEDVRQIKLAKKLVDYGFMPSAIWKEGPDALNERIGRELGGVQV
jgi:DNA-binding transcriptional MerR regulator